MIIKNNQSLSVLFYAAVFIIIVGLMSCATGTKGPGLGRIYSDLAKMEDPHRNAVILIPGILGSRLVDEKTNRVVWGAYDKTQVKPSDSFGAGLVALPLKEGLPLFDLKDNVKPAGVMDRIVVNFFGYPLEHQAYANILQTLGVGGYRDLDMGSLKSVDYGDRHYTCFQFDYDWRRDIVESARRLDQFILEKKAYIQAEIKNRFGIEKKDIKFDIVAHSMGGLVARYYLRYGTADVCSPGGKPEVTWAGAKHVERLVCVGTPSAGSVNSIISLVEGEQPSILLPHYAPAIIGTWPSLYQLLPRGRHKPLLDEAGQAINNIFSPDLWIENQWGLADKKQDKVLRLLLPEIDTAEERHTIAVDHLRKSLLRAQYFSEAIDTPAKPPENLLMVLFAGDAVETKQQLQIGSDLKLNVISSGPGDGTVLRSSALMNERMGKPGTGPLISPVRWDQVHFIFADHTGLTKDVAFTDNLLHILLERQVGK